jgi:ribosomal protein S18 acetylase RimI-like enzyme
MNLIKKLDVTKEKHAKDVLKLQIPAYRQEAALIGDDRLPPLTDTVRSLQTCGETFYGFYRNGKLRGVISCKVKGGVLDLHRLFVSPSDFRQGIAQKLFDFVQKNESRMTKMTVATAANNKPAIRFYEKNGFVQVKEQDTAEGIRLICFEKKISSDE